MNALAQFKSLLSRKPTRLKVEVTAVDSTNDTVTVQTVSGSTFNVIYDNAIVGDYLYVEGANVVGKAKSLTFVEIDI